MITKHFSVVFPLITQFPFPDSTQRAEIWRRIFLKSTPTEGLDYQKLGQLNVAGGNIRSIALNAAFLAVDANDAVTMYYMLQVAKSEYVKLERSLLFFIKQLPHRSIQVLAFDGERATIRKVLKSVEGVTPSLTLIYRRIIPC